MLKDCTTLIGVDPAHLQEASWCLPMLRKNRPELWGLPMLVLCDACQSVDWWQRQFAQFSDHPDCRFVPVPPVEGATQRHRMLSAFIYVALPHLSTKWWLKVDTDVGSLQNVPGWAPDEWFDDAKDFQFLASPWGYTRPPELHYALMEWAKTVPEFAGAPEPEWVLNVEKQRVWFPKGRIISYVCFGRTSYLKGLTALAPGPLMPTASQDGFLWYVAARLGLPYARPHMNKFGFGHRGRKMHRWFIEVMGK